MTISRTFQYSIKVLLTLLSVSLPTLSVCQEASRAEKLSTFLQIAEDLFHKSNLPGAGIAIVDSYDVVYTGGFGYTDLELEEPATENSLFFIGSTTKAFTGFAAGKLVDEELLDWKKPIIEYLPDFTLSEEYVARHVNLEDLFIHTTGLDRQDELWYGKPLTRDEVYNQTKTLEFKYSFRDEWLYNNHAYVIIGKVLETVSKNSWESIIKNEIFEPLQMTNSYTTYAEFLNHQNRVTGYGKDGKTEVKHINPDNIGPAGAMTSTPADISKWIKMLVNKGNYNGKKLISDDTYDYIMGPKGMSFTDTCSVKYYSIGWGGSRTHGQRTLRHSGQVGGNSARASIMPDNGFGIFIMTNQKSDYKAILTDYAEQIFVKNNFERDFDREAKLISYNRFIQFQNLLLDHGMEQAEEYYNNLKYRDFEESMNHLGQALLDAGYLGPALFVFKLNATENPTSSQANKHYVSALLENDDTNEAIEVLKKIIKLNPEDQNSKMRLNKLLNKK